ncbi:hypothetical protein [Corynebacterium renale]|uniref:hypothetical protein n=1 Tax=Corynebacterium renale TaxID=1724 RepID=UPI000A8A37B5|nr:hypothetical protein [Corynebacterium renale]
MNLHTPKHRAEVQNPAPWRVLGGCYVATVVLWAVYRALIYSETYAALRIVLVGCGVVAAVCAVLLAVRVLRRRDALVSPGNLFQAVVIISPTALLMTAFSVAYQQMVGKTLGGESSLLLLMAVSVTVPWISAAASRPLYPVVQQANTYSEVQGSARKGSDDDHILRAFAVNWPVVFCWSVLFVAGFSAVFGLALQLSLTGVAVYALGVLANVVFAQTLIAVQEVRRYGFVLAGWAAYAICLAAAPELWLVAPLVGMVPGVVLIAVGCVRTRGGWVSDAHTPHRFIVRDMCVGLGVGAVLWADKLFIVVALGEESFPVLYLLYVSLVPTVAGTALYWSRHYQFLQQAISRVWDVINGVPARDLQRTMCQAGQPADRALGEVMVPTALGGVAVVGCAPLLGFAPDLMLLMAVLAPQAFLALMIATHNLEQVSKMSVALRVHGVHVAACACALVAAFLPGALPWVYVLFIGVDVALTAYAVRVRRTTVLDAPYELFWKEAVAL